MFLVSDTLEVRQQMVRSFVPDEPFIALILAAADFEWTVRRAILALGKSPTKQLREVTFKYCSGLGKYQKCWKSEVGSRLQRALDEIVPDWKHLKEAYELRHELVHGATGTTSTKFATERVDTMLAASEAVARFAQAQMSPVYGRLRRRLKPRM